MEQMMDQPVICPLCQDLRVVLIETIETSWLRKIYRKQLGVDVALEFSALRDICFYQCINCELRFFYPSVAGSEHFYDGLQQLDWYYMEDKNEYNFASNMIKETDHVLDIGCGKGAFAKKISSREYVGLEFSREAQISASENDILVIKESVQQHACSNPEKYDVVCAFQVLEHIVDVYSFVESSVACLRPGGLLIFSVPSVESFARYIPNFTLDMPPHHVTRWTDRSLANVARLFPVEVVEIWHEPLQVVHRQMYAEAVLRNAFCNYLGRGIKVVDSSLFMKIASALIGRLGKVFARGLTSADLAPRGISVTCVYRKLEPGRS